MAGFLWRSETTRTGESEWMLRLSTVRKWYLKQFWDEELSVVRLGGKDHREQVIEPHRELLDEQRERVLFVCHIGEGEILQINKNEQLDSFRIMLADEFHWLAADFLEVIQEYLRERHPASWLLEQIEQGSEKEEV